MGMKSMYDLRDMLCKELDEITRKGELGAGDLDIVHKLTDAIKTLTRSRCWRMTAIPSADIPRPVTGRRTCAEPMVKAALMPAGAPIMSAAIIPGTVPGTI